MPVEFPLEDVTTQVLLWAVTGVLGWIVGRLAAYTKRERDEAQRAKDEAKALKDGVRALLRSELMRTHHQAVKAGYSSTLDKEVMQRTYDAYHALGGNGIATNLYQEMMGLPTRDD